VEHVSVVSNTGVRAVAEGCAQLRILVLASCNFKDSITDTGVLAIAQFCPQLQCIQLGHPRSDQDQGTSREFESKDIMDAALQALGAGWACHAADKLATPEVVALARGFRKLHHAIVSATAVTDESFIAQHESCKWLKSLWVDGTFHDVWNYTNRAGTNILREGKIPDARAIQEDGTVQASISHGVSSGCVSSAY
jgi:hypothetical protein